MPSRSRPQRSLTLIRILALLLVIGLSVFIFSIRDQAQRYAVYGYPGIFLVSFLAYATVILPAPGIAVIFTMGAVFNPFGVGVAAGAGAALGELTGYLTGFSGQAVVEHSRLYERLTTWMAKYGSVTIFVLSALPNPFFDIAGVAAGALKMPLFKFLGWCWLGETVKMIVFALLGDRAMYLFG